MNQLDQVIIVFIIVGAVIGLFRGFFKEIVGTIGLLLAAIAANYISPFSIPLIGTLIDSEVVAAIVVWIVVFIIAMLFMKGVAYLLDETMKAISMGWLNRLAGALFGALKYCLLAALAISIIEVVCAHVDGLKVASYLEGSQIVPWLHDMVDIIMPWASEHILSPALEMLKK